MAERLTARAPAKVNLVLEVLGKREDGYHDVRTILQTLELADEVTLGFGAEPGVTVTGRYAAGTPADETNLAWRAAESLAEMAGRSTDVLHITIDKSIPPAGGLGGGSSDAATTLRLLARAWRSSTAPVPKGEGRDVSARRSLLPAAARVGSDVPFFLTGGTALAGGRGETITPLPDLADHGVVLFVPSQTLEAKTGRMFAALDELPFDDGSISAALANEFPRAWHGTDVFNAFERVAFEMFPGLAELWEELETRIAEPIHMAGAGPTLFWIGPVGEAAGVAARAAGLPCTVIETRTSRSLWRR